MTTRFVPSCRAISSAMNNTNRPPHVGRHVRAIPVVEWPRDVVTSLSLDHGFAEVASVPDDELPALLEAHFAPLRERGEPISDSAPLFGGLILEVDATRRIYPQCCGDLSDVASWLDPDDSRSGKALVATAGHPCPELFREGEMVRLACADRDEPFHPRVDRDVAVPAASLRAAVASALEQLEAFARRLERTGHLRGHPGLAQILAGRSDLAH